MKRLNPLLALLVALPTFAQDSSPQELLKKLPPLPFKEEAVGNFKMKGVPPVVPNVEVKGLVVGIPLTIDEAFTAKNENNPPSAPFRVVVPKDKDVLVLAGGKKTGVPELVKFTTASPDKKAVEILRLTNLTIPLQADPADRLKLCAYLLQKQALPGASKARGRASPPLGRCASRSGLVRVDLWVGADRPFLSVNARLGLKTARRGRDACAPLSAEKSPAYSHLTNPQISRLAPCRNAHIRPLSGTSNTSIQRKEIAMNDRDQRRYDRLTRVQTFGRDNSTEFASGSKAKTHFANVDQHLKDLDDAKAGQTPARVSKETLLDALMLDFKTKTLPAPPAPSRSRKTASPRPTASRTTQANPPSPRTLMRCC
jgi:hypothetical protein